MTITADEAAKQLVSAVRSNTDLAEEEAILIVKEYLEGLRPVKFITDFEVKVLARAPQIKQAAKALKEALVAAQYWMSPDELTSGQWPHYDKDEKAITDALKLAEEAGI